MKALPDDTLVVRGELNLPENFARGSGVLLGEQGALQGVSVNAAPSETVESLTGLAQKQVILAF